MQRFGESNEINEEEGSSNLSYERIGRIALSYLNGAILGHEPEIESYVQRVPVGEQIRMRQILEEVIVPLAEIPNTSLPPF